jgi:hypothetical protein
MPAYEISVYLVGGAKASIIVEGTNVTAVEQSLKTQVFNHANSVVYLTDAQGKQGALYALKSQILAYTVDDAISPAVASRSSPDTKPA